MAGWRVDVLGGSRNKFTQHSKFIRWMHLIEMWIVHGFRSNLEKAISKSHSLRTNWRRTITCNKLWPNRSSSTDQISAMCVLMLNAHPTYLHISFLMHIRIELNHFDDSSHPKRRIHILEIESNESFEQIHDSTVFRRWFIACLYVRSIVYTLA